MRFRSGRPAAFAQLRGGKDAPGLIGIVRFYQLPAGVMVDARVSGLPNNGSGFHGFHIHEGAACAGEEFSVTGSHYNPTQQLHPKHAGDLPSLLSYGGRARLSVVTDRFSIPDIIGRTVVVHSHADDFHTQPAGDAGTKIACGVIRKYP